MPAGDLLRDAGELAGRTDAAGVPHARVLLVRLDVAAPTAAIIHVGVVVGLLRGVRGGRPVGVRGTSAAAG